METHEFVFYLSYIGTWTCGALVGISAIIILFYNLSKKEEIKKALKKQEEEFSEQVEEIIKENQKGELL